LTDNWGGGEVCMSVGTPQILLRAVDGRFSPLFRSEIGRGVHV
jgi:hypothetical protein